MVPVKVQTDTEGMYLIVTGLITPISIKFFVYNKATKSERKKL